MNTSSTAQPYVLTVLAAQSEKKGRCTRFFMRFVMILLLGCFVTCGGTEQAKSPPLTNAATPLSTPTYDGSGQGMHPGIVAFSSNWHGFQYWMSLTPYPNNDDKAENPSILASNNGLEWMIPTGLTNPVAPYQPYHQMDSDLLYDANSDQLWLYYLRGNSQALLLRRTSADGVHWSDEEQLLAVSYNTMVSPAIAKVNGVYELWSVNPAGVGCSATQTQVEHRTSTDGVYWSPPSAVVLHQAGFETWHIDVSWIESLNEYWAIYAAYPDGHNCGSTALYFAKSTDGLNWTTFPQAALTGKAGNWDADQIYRSTVLYDFSSDTVRLWYSAQRNRVWHTGYTQANYQEFLKALEQ